MAQVWGCLLCEATLAGQLVRKSSRRRDLCDWCMDELLHRGQDWCATGKHAVPVADMAKGRSCCKAHQRERLARYGAASTRDRRAYGKAWREQHHSTALAYGRAYRAAHQEDLKARQRARYWADPAAARAQSRADYQKRRAQAVQYARAWREQHRDRSRAIARRGRERLKVQTWRRLFAGVNSVSDATEG